jgi:hypothetical protein
MDPLVLSSLQHGAAVLLASVILITVIFLIARVARVRQTLALALALSPMAVLLALDKVVPVFASLS